LAEGDQIDDLALTLSNTGCHHGVTSGRDQPAAAELRIIDGLRREFNVAHGWLISLTVSIRENDPGPRVWLLRGIDIWPVTRI
jgi:hypothetical protein